MTCVNANKKQNKSDQICKSKLEQHKKKPQQNNVALTNG